MMITTFSNQTPPWNLSTLDSNFSQLNTAVASANSAIASNSAAITALQNSIGSPTSFTCSATGAYTNANLTLLYVTLGPLVWVYTTHDIGGNSNNGNSITFTSFPPAITPSADQYIYSPAYFAAGNSFGNFFTNVLTSSTGVLQSFYAGALPTNTIFGFAKGVMFNYVIQ